ncbi:MAG TPA: hypothetical protein PKB14_03805 [Rubrivivax sp.]|nr:hypothetical protein [Rubrivivax sp.]
MKPCWILAALLAAHGTVTLAQTVYESKDKAGTVFSDRPSPGAVPVQVPPPNVVSPPQVQPEPPAPAASAPAYRRLVIVRPAAQDMVHSNTGAFDISANLSPRLRPEDRVRVLIDGNLVPTAFRSTSIRISEQDWRSAATGETGEHTLQLAVVDAGGRPWIESETLRFYLRGVAAGGRRR